MNKRKLTIIITYALVFLIACFIPSTPKVSDDNTKGSAVQVLNHIYEISKKPHSVFDQENIREVQKYLEDTAKKYTSESAVKTYEYKDVVDEKNDDVYPINNILTTIKGKNTTGILLVAHYDSRGHIGRFGELGGSYGAADDGYGIGVLLEILRLYGKSTDLENSIYVLMTDGEETGLFGANFAANESEIMEKVNFVINVEARGIKGPAYMFETSKANSKVIDLYRKANNPYSYSIATAVYQVMPNYTDFTEFLAVGKAGINFAVLDNLEYYHTPNDNYSNVNASSIQHYLNQIIPIVQEYTSNAKYNDMNYFEAKTEQVFFMLLPNVLISYNEVVALILCMIGILVLVFILFMNIKEKKINSKKVCINIGIVFAGIIIMFVIGYVLANLASIFYGVPYSLSNTKVLTNPFVYYVSLMLIFIVLYKLLQKYNKKINKTEFLLAANIVLQLISLVCALALKGASFFFFFPSFLSLIGMIVNKYCKDKNIILIVINLSVLIAILINIPLIYGLYQALTIGGLGVFYVLFFFFAIVVIPTIQKSFEEIE